MTTRTKPEWDRQTEPYTTAVDKNPQNKGGTLSNGLASKDPMYREKNKYVVRHHTPTDQHSEGYD